MGIEINKDITRVEVRGGPIVLVNTERGPQGIPGPEGSPGGRTILNGGLPPVAGYGEVGDFYLDTTNAEIYGPKTAEGWGDPVSLVGPEGPASTVPGPEGPAGPQGPQGETGAQGEVGPQGPQGIQGPSGADGAEGPQGPQGEPGPQGETGPEGPASTVPGPEGPAGADGNTVLNGDGAPDSGLGAEGDFYIDTTNDLIYGPKSAGAWGAGTSMIGPEGPQGPQGIQGPAGSSSGDLLYGGSSSIDAGTGKPYASTGVNGDFFLFTGNPKTLFGPKASGAWPTGTSLVGPTGSQGPQGIQGPAGPAGADSTVPGPEGPQGPQGETGPQGPQGEVGPQGPIGLTGPEGPQGPEGAASTVPGPQGEQGPQGIQGETGPQGEQGPQGETGPSGADGKSVLNGSGAPSSGLGSDGDFYIDTTNDSIYGPKTAGVWGIGISLIGPQGEEGPQGPQGIQGEPGPKGDTGDTGPAGDTGSTGPEGDSAYEVAVANGFVGDEATWLASLQGAEGPKGDTGDTGPAGQGVPTGGTTDQILAKASGTDFDTTWVDAPTGGGGTGTYYETVTAELTAISTNLGYIDKECFVLQVPPNETVTIQKAYIYMGYGRTGTHNITINNNGASLNGGAIVSVTASFTKYSANVTSNNTVTDGAIIRVYHSTQFTASAQTYFVVSLLLRHDPV